jgi:serine/threonine protein kinase
MYLESSPVNHHSIVRETQVMVNLLVYTILANNNKSKIKICTKVRSYDADGKKVLNGYVMEQLLGHGSHGKVKLCRHSETGEMFAIKIIPKHTKRRRLGMLGGNGSNSTLEKVRYTAITQ